MTEAADDSTSEAAPGEAAPVRRSYVSKRMAFLPVAFGVGALDQLGKWHATTTLEVGEHLPLIGNLLMWTHQPARGGALGVFRDWVPGAQLVGFALLAIIATTIIISFYRGLARGEHGSAAALGAILGGIASNALDHLRYGTSLDFLHLGSAQIESLPDFNLADIAIVLGVVTLIVELLATEMAARASERPRP